MIKAKFCEIRVSLLWPYLPLCFRVQTISFYNNVIVHYSVGRKKRESHRIDEWQLLWKSLSMASMIIIIRLYVSLFFMFYFLSHTGSTVDGNSKFFKNSAVICSLDKILIEGVKHQIKCYFILLHLYLAFFCFFRLKFCQWSRRQRNS